MDRPLGRKCVQQLKDKVEITRIDPLVEPNPHKDESEELVREMLKLAEKGELIILIPGMHW